MTTPVEMPHRIGGEDRPPADGAWMDDVAPATGEVIGRSARGGAADVDAAVGAARGAVDGAWGRLSAVERADVLDAIAEGLEARTEELARMESRDTGKPIGLARRVDVPRAVANFRFFAGAIRHDETPCHPMPGGLNYTLRRPLGVVGLITPWNLPLYLLTWKAAPALALGNGVVAKPSELTPRTATALAAIAEEQGLPPGAFNLVHGYGGEAGHALVSHPDVDGVSFTGGTETGSRVSEAAAPSFKKLSLELGGKNPNLVFADADFDRALDGTLRAAFTNQGQVCLCGSRILVERSRHDELVEALVERARAMRIGDPDEEDTQLGSLINPAHRDRVASYVDLARREGGRVLCGGAPPDVPEHLDGEAFYAPTVIAGLSPEARCAREEIFGPVVTVHPFDDEEEAVRLANGVRYGLASSLWTRDLDRAHRVAARIEAGTVWVNCWMRRDLRVPFGGVKESGLGREGGAWSMDFFGEPRNVCIQVADDASGGRR